jgi:hypothetical protein
MSERSEHEISVSLIPRLTLIAAARGAIDLNEMAHYELAKRGMNKFGEFVGHTAAAIEWSEHFGGA